MELLNLDYNKEKEQLEMEMANRRWKKYKQFGRKMTPKEIHIYRDRYNKSAVYGFKQNKKK